MSPTIVALEFVGLWLLVGIGLFLGAVGARRMLALVSVHADGTVSAAGAQLLGRVVGAGLAVVGLACAFGGLAMLVTFFVTH